MRLTGYCTTCHKVKRVNVKPHDLVLAQARGGTPQGVCAECEQREEEARRERSRRR